MVVLCTSTECSMLTQINRRKTGKNVASFFFFFVLSFGLCFSTCLNASRFIYVGKQNSDWHCFKSPCIRNTVRKIESIRAIDDRFAVLRVIRKIMEWIVWWLRAKYSQSSHEMNPQILYCTSSIGTGIVMGFSLFGIGRIHLDKTCNYPSHIQPMNSNKKIQRRVWATCRIEKKKISPGVVVIVIRCKVPTSLIGASSYINSYQNISECFFVFILFAAKCYKWTSGSWHKTDF